MPLFSLDPTDGDDDEECVIHEAYYWTLTSQSNKSRKDKFCLGIVNCYNRFNYRELKVANKI